MVHLQSSRQRSGRAIYLFHLLSLQRSLHNNKTHDGWATFLFWDFLCTRSFALALETTCISYERALGTRAVTKLNQVLCSVSYAGEFVNTVTCSLDEPCQLSRARAKCKTECYSMSSLCA